MASSRRASTPTQPLLATLSAPHHMRLRFLKSKTTDDLKNALDAEGSADKGDDAEGLTDAEAYAAQLDAPDEAVALPIHFPDDPEVGFANAARDALYAMRDAVRDMETVSAYTENAKVADRLRRDGVDPQMIRNLLSEIQRIIARTGSAYSRHMFGVDVDLK